MAVSRTQKALALVDKGMTVAEAARKAEITESAVYAAVRRLKVPAATGVCKCCGGSIDSHGKAIKPASHK